MGLSVSKSSVLYVHSFTAFGFAAAFLLGSFGIDVPGGPKEMLAGYDIAAVPGWKLLSRFAATWLTSFGFIERILCENPTAQKVYDFWHVSLTLWALTCREGFANDMQYYQICALLGGFAVAGLVSKPAEGTKKD